MYPYACNLARVVDSIGVRQFPAGAGWQKRIQINHAAALV